MSPSIARVTKCSPNQQIVDNVSGERFVIETIPKAGTGNCVCANMGKCLSYTADWPTALLMWPYTACESGKGLEFSVICRQAINSMISCVVGMHKRVL